MLATDVASSAADPGRALAATASAPSEKEATAESWLRPLRHRLLAFGAAVLLLTLLGLGYAGVQAVEQRLEPEITATSTTVGRGLANQFETALGAGVPFGQLAGVEEFLQTATGFDARIGFAALVDDAGRLAHVAGPAAESLPSQFENLQSGEGHYRHNGQRAMPVAIAPEGQVAGYVLVGVRDAVPEARLRLFLLHAALALLAFLVLLSETLRAVLVGGLERPAEALARLARAVAQRDLSRTSWLAAPGSLGRLLAAARARLGAANAAFHAFLLDAFAARAGHFDPPVLREVTEVVRRGLADYRLPPVTGAWSVPLGEGGLLRTAIFALVLGEMMLVPAWGSLPALERFSAPEAAALLMLPLLLALPLGFALGGRLLGGFARGLTFTAGALIAAAALLGLALVGAIEQAVALRVLGGLGLGLALRPLGSLVFLARGLVLGFVAGAGPGLLALFLLGPESVAPLAALVTAAAGIAVGQTLPPRDEGADRVAEGSPSAGDPPGRNLGSLLPIAGLAAVAMLVPILAPLSGDGLGAADSERLLLLSVVLMLAAGFGGFLSSRKLQRGASAICAVLAAAVLAMLGAAAPPFALDLGIVGSELLLPAAIFLAVVSLIGRGEGAGAGPAVRALVAAVGLAAAFLLLQLAGPAAVAFLAAVLMLASATTARWA